MMKHTLLASLTMLTLTGFLPEAVAGGQWGGPQRDRTRQSNTQPHLTGAGRSLTRSNTEALVRPGSTQRKALARPSRSAAMVKHLRFRLGRARRPPAVGFGQTEKHHRERPQITMKKTGFMRLEVYSDRIPTEKLVGDYLRASDEHVRNYRREQAYQRAGQEAPAALQERGLQLFTEERSLERALKKRGVDFELEAKRQYPRGSRRALLQELDTYRYRKASLQGEFQDQHFIASEARIKERLDKVGRTRAPTQRMSDNRKRTVSRATRHLDMVKEIQGIRETKRWDRKTRRSKKKELRALSKKVATLATEVRSRGYNRRSPLRWERVRNEGQFQRLGLLLGKRSRGAVTRIRSVRLSGAADHAGPVMTIRASRYGKLVTTRTPVSWANAQTVKEVLHLRPRLLGILAAGAGRGTVTREWDAGTNTTTLTTVGRNGRKVTTTHEGRDRRKMADVARDLANQARLSSSQFVIPR